MDNKPETQLYVEIAGYCRISNDELLDQENTSIENQKRIIEEFVKVKFPNCKLSFYEDRDLSGYSFDQRVGYQKMRRRLMNGDVPILIIKDFSRFARRNSRGLVELEDLRDAGVRIISVGDGIDYPTYDDWMTIQFHFLVNEMPVTQTSKKVKNVIRQRQMDGKWLCSVPYGYVITDMKKQEIEIVPDEAEIIREIFRLYVKEGWGYKRIANHLTDLNVPTPRMKEKLRKEARGEECKRKVVKEWSIVTVQGIIQNDFYIGTLRQGKYMRKNINGTDIKIPEDQNLVFEKHHEPIIDDRMWVTAQGLLKERTTEYYRGTKKYDNMYSGIMFCADCGAPMFATSRADLPASYTCGTYHKRGKKACSAHRTRVDMLDVVIKNYIQKVRDNSSGMIKHLEKEMKNEPSEIQETENATSVLERHLEDAKDELKAIKKRKIKEIARLETRMKDRPGLEDQIEILEETYSELEEEVTQRILGLQNQIALASNKRNEIIRFNRLTKTVIDVFDSILEKDKLDKADLRLIVERITVSEEQIDIKMCSDVEALLSSGRAAFMDNASNFKTGSEVILTHEGRKAILSIEGSLSNTTKVRLKARNQVERLFTVNVISSGDPLEIFTDREGEIILKKYSPIGELSVFAKQFAESMAQTTGHIAVIADRDQFIAMAGTAKKELLAKSVSRELEDLMTDRESIVATKGEKGYVPVSPEADEYEQQVIAPIISEGDVIGAVMILSKDKKERFGNMELKIAGTAAAFLGRQMEQ